MKKIKNMLFGKVYLSFREEYLSYHGHARRIQTLILLLSLIFLPGCVVPVIFVAGAATGAIIYDQRSAKTMVEDRDVAFQVQHKLDSDPELRSKAHVSITSFNHIALLLGQVPNDALRSRAEAIAKSNSNVKMLYNEVTVGSPTSSMTRANDTWITTKIKTVLATVSGLNSTTLKIVTEDKVVYLMGLTTRAQAQLATERVRTVAGVEKVVKLFEYLK